MNLQAILAFKPETALNQPEPFFVGSDTALYTL